MRTIPRLQVSVLALLVVLIPAYFAVVRGETVDVDAFVYAVPICAAAFAVLMIGFRFAFPQDQFFSVIAPAAGSRVRRAATHPSLHLAFSVVALAIVGGFFVTADADARAYRDDPTCMLILTYEPPNVGACRVQPAEIVDTSVSSIRGGTRRHLHVQFSDGSSRWIVLAGDYPRELWTDARNATVHDAVVQWYHGRIVALTTTSGRAMTDAMPSTRTTGLFIMSLALALSGIFSAVRILLTQPAT